MARGRLAIPESVCCCTAENFRFFLFSSDSPRGRETRYQVIIGLFGSSKSKALMNPPPHGRGRAWL